MDIKNNNGRIDIIRDADGKSLVLVNDIRFKGRRGIDWKEVETFEKRKVIFVRYFKNKKRNK